MNAPPAAVPKPAGLSETATAALRKRGWTIVPQVGVSKFRIDLGIVHPDRPGDYRRCRMRWRFL